MALEVEIKLRIDEPERLRERLRVAGAVPSPRVLEQNVLFDTREGALRDAGIGLRLRERLPIDGGAALPATLTAKGPRRPGPLKIREEFESPVGDAAAVRRLLLLLGYRARVHYEKRRESWRLGESLIEIDELPRLGWFVEIEGPTPEQVLALRRELGLDEMPEVRESYVELAVEHGDPRDGAYAMLFDP